MEHEYSPFCLLTKRPVFLFSSRFTSNKQIFTKSSKSSTEKLYFECSPFTECTRSTHKKGNTGIVHSYPRHLPPFFFLYFGMEGVCHGIIRRSEEDDNLGESFSPSAMGDLRIRPPGLARRTFNPYLASLVSLRVSLSNLSSLEPLCIPG